MSYAVLFPGQGSQHPDMLPWLEAEARVEVSVAAPDGRTVMTGLKKFGAVVGDYAEIGCNSVLSPGSVIGRRSIVYPGMQWRGVLNESQIAKIRHTVEIVNRRS